MILHITKCRVTRSHNLDKVDNFFQSSFSFQIFILLKCLTFRNTIGDKEKKGRDTRKQVMQTKKVQNSSNLLLNTKRRGHGKCFGPITSCARKCWIVSKILLCAKKKKKRPISKGELKTKKRHIKC